MRSLLFVPGNRPDRITKALASEADAVCIDLEDAVPLGDKQSARKLTVDMLATLSAPSKAIGVRINGRETDFWRDDLKALPDRLAFVMVPKAASADDLARTASLAPSSAALIPIVESAAGLMNAWEIAASEKVIAVLFGAFDYSADVGCEMTWEAMLFARSLLVAAAARARIELLDSPSGNLADQADLATTTLKAKSLGFTGRACIHPSQVGTVNEVMSPTEEQIAWARRVIAALGESSGAAAQLDGQLIEKPVALAAARILNPTNRVNT